MVRFRITVYCDHPGCQATTAGDCRVEPGEFMARGIFDVKTEIGEWKRFGLRHYCPEHQSDAGVRGEP